MVMIISVNHCTLQCIKSNWLQSKCPFIVMYQSMVMILTKSYNTAI